MERFQKTVGNKIVIKGLGLHSGKNTTIEISPAAADTGIVFQRVDSSNTLSVSALPLNISSTALSTTIGSGQNAVATIEHVMAALHGLGVDNAIIHIDGPEVPIMDGSAAPFVREIIKSGLRLLTRERKYLLVKDHFEFKNGDQYIKLAPATKPVIRCAIDFKRKLIGRQSMEYKPSPENFIKIANARTFCHIDEVSTMRQNGLALGGSLDNAVVVTDTDIMNREGLRGSNEFVRHKLLDLIGDLALLGAPIVGSVDAFKPGHKLHAEFMLSLLNSKNQYLDLVTASELLQLAPQTKPAARKVAAATLAYG